MSRLNFSNEDYLNLLAIYYESDKIISRACRVFSQRYPDRSQPSRDTIHRIISNCLNYGSFKKPVNKVKPVVDNEENEINVLAFFHAFPGSGLRDAETHLRIPFKSIERILLKHKWKPFKYHIVHSLVEGDFVRRVNFCEMMLIKTQEDPEFLEKIIWTDEAKFSRNGLFNWHNSHYRSPENLFLARETHFQESWSFNVHCAIKHDRIFSLHIYEENLTGNGYVNLLTNIIESEMDNLPLNIYSETWYQHDGAPAHGTNEVCTALNRIFDDRWLGNNGPHLWPPRSPDLIPLDFFLWGHIKNVVYKDPITTKEDLVQRVRNAIGELNENTIRAATTNEFLTRVNKCLEVNGRTFEQLINN